MRGSAADRRFVLLVADMLHPGHVLAVERFLHRHVDHVHGWRSAMPVLFIRRNPDHVAAFDFTDLAAPSLHQAGAGYDEQRLAERMGVPGRARTGLETDQAGTHPR